MGILTRFFNRLTGKQPPGDGGQGPGASDEMMSCQEALERLFEYMDGELDGVTERQVAEHFKICKRCYPRLQFENAFRKAIERAQDGQAAPPEVKERILEVLELEDGGAS